MMQQDRNHPIPYFSWKNANFSQIVTSIAKNTPTTGDAPHPNFIRNRILPKNQIGRINIRKSGALPLKIYRRELNTNPTGNPRVAIKIDEFNRPNGNLVKSNTSPCLENALPADLQTPNSRSENGLMDCNINNASVCMADNARRRVRSGGMIRNKSYCTDTPQYLTSRNRTFVQNQYNLVRTTESSLLNPETEKIADNKSNLNSFYRNNMFVANGSDKCETAPYVVENEYLNEDLIPFDSGNAVHNTFQYYWDSSSTPVNVFLPYGEYHLEEFNSVLTNKMVEQGHYYINKTTGTNEYLLKLIYNYQLKKIELQALPFAFFEANPAMYMRSQAGWSSNVTKTPAIKILELSKLQYSVGLNAGTYPADYMLRTEKYAVVSNISGKLLPRYIYPSITYKPSNYKYSNQGAVSSSSRLLRLQYDTINTAASSYSGVLGKNVAHAMSYRVSENINKFKDKLGYPLKKTPVFSKGVQECYNYTSCNTAEYNN